MSDIELVIKIPESRYRLLQKQAKTNLGRGKLDEFAEAVLNGTPLPKGHGRLIDADSMWNAYHDLDYDFYEAFDLADTIVEADNSESVREYGQNIF